ncbi:MAG: aminodeoxychorismate/anthranilate synthase component II [Bacteroidetes bacterium]|nr:aminodeoxychorismate/anthranilate synthase component II [Bacteroidota bacterium]|tara:strand:- start:102 stop:671 length:570 start_codon:yes stop_codon:yes gene_type:complete
MKIVVIDNYDSFTYNLVQYVKNVTGTLPDVFRNDKISAEEASKYDKILLSPGPGVPNDAGNLKEIIKVCSKTSDIFGVCLGMQAIAEVYGGELYNLSRVFHGVSSPIQRTDEIETVFNGLPASFDGARYHSWIVSENNFPSELKITALDDDGNIMALAHRDLAVRGVQFHPESILTEYGGLIIKNWISN